MATVIPMYVLANLDTDWNQIEISVFLNVIKIACMVCTSYLLRKH